MPKSSDKAIISTDDLSVIYFLGKSNQVNAITKAKLEICPGEFVIFFGPSGCGKSTLLYAISGLERNIHGSILIGGKNLVEFDSHELDYYRRKKIGMVFQAYYLINSLTILENVELPQMSDGIDRPSRRKHARELLEFFGVGLQADKYPNELSGGQQQRAAICRALMNDPDIILADEPTGNLDSKSTQDVMNVLRDLNEKKGKTIILVTHSPAMLEYADKVFYMKDGQITDMKENKDKHPGKVEAGNLTGGTGLGLLAKSYTDFDLNKEGGFLAEYQALNIVLKGLTGLEPEELEKIKNKVAKLITKGKDHELGLAEFLDKEMSSPSFDLDKRTAERLAKDIESTIDEMKLLEDEEKKVKAGLVPDRNAEVKQVRQYLFDLLDVNLSNLAALERINDIICNRLENRVDQNEVVKSLSQSLKHGGVGLSPRLARKFARHLELLAKTAR